MEDCWESESISMLAGVQTENSIVLRNARGCIGLGVLLASTDTVQSRNSKFQINEFEGLSDTKTLHSSFMTQDFKTQSLLKKVVIDDVWTEIILIFGVLITVTCKQDKLDRCCITLGYQS